MTGKKSKDEAFVDAVADALAEDVEISDAEIDARHTHAMQAIKEARREALKQARAKRGSSPPQSVPARILAMTREAIVARLEELQAMFPGELALEHRKLGEVSLGDLQLLLVDAEYLTATDGSDDSADS